MSNPSKRRGSSWEQTIVDYLIEQGWVLAERRVTNGAKDRGDIAGVMGVCIEAKAQRAFDLAGWVNEAQTETRNADAKLGVVWAKRPRKGSAADGYVILTGADFTQLLKEAGY